MPTLVIGEISIEVTRKRIKSLRIAVYPPDGRVAVSAPLLASDQTVREAVLAKLDWIRKAQQKMRARGAAAAPAPKPLKLASGEEVLFRGQTLRLSVVETSGRPQAALLAGGVLELRARPRSTRAERAELLESFYRAYLTQAVPPLVALWQARLGVRAGGLTLRRMKTRWGSCNTRTGRITLNLELARRSDACLELVLVHELLHLLERGHTPKFRALMSQYLPNWKTLEKELKRLPLAVSR